MTEHQVINPLSLGVDYESLAERFRPIFARIANGAVQRELNRELPRWRCFPAAAVPVAD